MMAEQRRPGSRNVHIGSRESTLVMTAALNPPTFLPAEDCILRSEPMAAILIDAFFS